MDAPRKRRSEQSPSIQAGVYALFLAPNGHFPEIAAKPGDLLYIGKAAGASGLAQRCHFAGGTSAHSPRRTLAALLRSRLGLQLRAVNSKKFGLTSHSERELDRWMEDNLLVAYEVTPEAVARENALVALHAPPLNLTICEQSVKHRRISRLRHEALATANCMAISEASRKTSPTNKPANAKSLDTAAQTEPIRRPASPTMKSASIDSAPIIAKRYGLTGLQYRNALRKQNFPWHSWNASWDVCRGSPEWRQMIAVAELVSGKSLGELDR